MKKTLFLSLFALIAAINFAQTISDVRAETQAGKIVVHYYLNTQKPTKLSLSYSDNGGRTFKPCRSIIGLMEKQGAGKHSVTWD
ncbi:MAG: hypothetical protein LBS25_05500, partial [Candidatus Symbiothrix sp.]|nr:hypothetical protein [Candidatus Symbiothrix sp.]